MTVWAMHHEGLVQKVFPGGTVGHWFLGNVRADRLRP